MLQYSIIKPMLCLKPEDRPEAKALKKDLEECICRLNAHEIDGHSSRSVWSSKGEKKKSQIIAIRCASCPTNVYKDGF